jgi:hypothetical protein
MGKLQFSFLALSFKKNLPLRHKFLSSSSLHVKAALTGRPCCFWQLWTAPNIASTPSECSDALTVLG